MIDISKQINELCALFGLDPDFVSNIEIRPGRTTIKITTLRRNEHNQAFLEDGDVATSIHTYDVRTYAVAA